MHASQVLSSSFLFLLALCIVALLPSPRSTFFRPWLPPASSRSSTERGSAEGGGCDYSDGRWVRGAAATTAYREDCPFLDPGFRCTRNGRSDSSFRHWRWQPRRCRLPMHLAVASFKPFEFFRFNATEMLERSRNGRIVFAGDSIGRNQWESMVCMLAGAVPPGTGRVYEQTGKPISRHRGYLSMVFADHNLSVEYYRAPMIVRVDRFPAKATSGGAARGAVRLDVLPRHADRWAGADVLVLNTGHWWNLHKTVKAGNYFMVGDRLNKTMDIKEAFRLSLQTVKDWKLRSAPLPRSYFFFRSYSPSHYSNGTWDTGGSCGGRRDPVTTYDGHGLGGEYSWINAVIAETTEGIRSHGREARFLNITHMTELRPDGHPSRHREPGTPPDAPEDCSHWCLPGVPDTWNEVLYAHLLSMGYGTRIQGKIGD